MTICNNDREIYCRRPKRVWDDEEPAARAVGQQEPSSCNSGASPAAQEDVIAGTPPPGQTRALRPNLPSFGAPGDELCCEAASRRATSASMTIKIDNDIMSWWAESTYRRFDAAKKKQEERAWVGRSAGLGRLGDCLASLLAWHGSAGSAADDPIVVVLEEGQSLRDLAEQHLGDPDLWMEILRANDLAVSDVRPGIEIAIPVSQIAAADRALQQSLDLIQKATLEGARLFAPDEIAQAIWLRDAAVAHRKAGAWDEAVRVAGDANAHGREGAGERAGAARLRRRGAAQRSPRLGRGTAAGGRRLERSRHELGPDRGGEGQDPFALDGADHLSRRQPPAPQSQLAGRDPAHAHRSAEPRARRPRSRWSRAISTPCWPARAAQDLRPGDPGRRDRDRIRPTSGCATTTTGSKFANYDERTLEVAAAGRERHARQERRHGRALGPGAEREDGRADRPGARRARGRRGRLPRRSGAAMGAAWAMPPATGSRWLRMPTSPR